jgi:7-carboxy-7-deazaguanine synthase
MSSTLPIHERFHAFQGEGVHMGRSAFFIRTFGCPLHCSWCDSAGTWHPEWRPKDILRMEPWALVDEAFKSMAEFVVVTGGEPAVHDLNELTGMLRIRGIPSHLETSGAIPIKGKFDWVTCSPKDSMPALEEVMRMANEFKLIISKPSDIKRWVDFIHPFRQVGAQVWLHPEWSCRNDSDILRAIAQVVTTPHTNLRAGYQLHKLYRCDALDNRSAKPAPLGGKPNLGY